MAIQFSKNNSSLGDFEFGAASVAGVSVDVEEPVLEGFVRFGQLLSAIWTLSQ